jgi:hypothetical protein
MPKYIFSQGKIRVEEGVYQPLLKHKQKVRDTFVLLFTSRSQSPSSDESAPREKEQENVQHPGST